MPRYRMSQWLDTSPESLARPQARILYGVQARSADFSLWCHVHDAGEVCLFDDMEECGMFIDLLRLSDAPSA